MSKSDTGSLPSSVKGNSDPNMTVLPSKYASKGRAKATNLPPRLPPLALKDFAFKQSVKQLSLWFNSWRVWQQRMAVCHIIEHCSAKQLELLATALEPTLHLDFSSSFVPHLASLHLDGAATFQVQRGVTHDVLDISAIEGRIGTAMELEASLCLTSSVPMAPISSSTESSDTMNRARGKRFTTVASFSRDHEKPSKLIGSVMTERGSLLPVLPLSHVDHATTLSPRHVSIADSIARHRKRFASVPDFRSTTDLLTHVKNKEFLRQPHHGQKHQRSVSEGGHISLHVGGKQTKWLAESFKGQLATLSKWMSEWEGSQKALLLSELVKLCNKDLLSYLVQCLYQRLLKGEMKIESLSDVLLLKIFSYLDPQSLCKCSQVCQRWRHVSESAQLWRAHCWLLGLREGVGDLATAIEIAMGDGGGEGGGGGGGGGGGRGGGRESTWLFIDWKQAYRTLYQVMSRIKELVIQAASMKKKEGVSLASCELLPSATPQSAIASLKASLSLRGMLELVAARTGALSTRDTLRLAPESVTTLRRRLRAEKRAEREEREKEALERTLSDKYQHRRPSDRRTGASRLTDSTLFDASLVGELSLEAVADIEQRGVGEREISRDKIGGVARGEGRVRIELVSVALDQRPHSLYLPDPDGIRCLILAGALTAGHTPKPGRVQPIPRLRRLKPFGSAVLCLQCDARKIVLGTADREIHVHDIRTGRYVHSFIGHKGSVQCLQFDENRMVSGSWDTTCIVWDIIHCNVLKELRGHTDCVSCLQFDDERLITGSYDKSIRIWSTSSWCCTVVIGTAHKRPVTCLRFNSSVIASGSADKSVKIWCPTSGHSLGVLEHDAALSSLQLSNQLLISACQSGLVQLWNLHSFSPLMQWSLRECNCHITGMAVTRTKVFGAGSDGVVYEWEIATGTCSRALTGHSRAVTAVWVGEHKIVSASEDCTVGVWYTRKALTLAMPEEAELDPDFMDLPIRVMNQ